MKPILAYPRSGGCTMIGGYVVADRRLRSLYKRYVYADFCEGRLRSLVPLWRSPRRPPDRALGRRARPPSAKTSAAGSTSPPWKAPSSASSRR